MTVGQAFGGDLEAVTIPDSWPHRWPWTPTLSWSPRDPGIWACRNPLGFSGVAAGEAVNAAATSAMRPVGALRISGADARRGIAVSHHSLTAYGRVALCPCDIAVPDFADDPALSGLVGDEDLVDSGGTGWSR